MQWGSPNYGTRQMFLLLSVLNGFSRCSTFELVGIGLKAVAKYCTAQISGTNKTEGNNLVWYFLIAPLPIVCPVYPVQHFVTPLRLLTISQISFLSSSTDSRLSCIPYYKMLKFELLQTGDIMRDLSRLFGYDSNAGHHSRFKLPVILRELCTNFPTENEYTQIIISRSS